MSPPTFAERFDLGGLAGRVGFKRGKSEALLIRDKAANALKKVIDAGELLEFDKLAKNIEVPATTLKRVYDEKFAGTGVIKRSRNAVSVIDDIIKSGVTDPDKIKQIAKETYKINIGDRNISRLVNVATDASVENYLDDFKKMTSDATYKPKYIKPATETGLTANQIKAKKIAKETIEGFDEKLLRNINKRKKLTRWQDPEKREYDLIKKAERKAKRRALKFRDDIKLTDREVKLNFDQRKITRNLNTVINNKPELVLNNKALLERLSFTVSKNGDIIKIKPNLEEIRTRGIVEVEHQRDIFKKGKLKDFPYNRNLILGPYNRPGGFKIMAETFIEKNPDPNNVKVKNIIKKAKELGITLQPNVPKGTFATKSIGYIQQGGPVEKFKNAAKHVFKVAKPVLKYALKVVPVVGATVGLADVAKAKEMGLTRPEELATAYYTSPEIAKGWKDIREYDYKDRAAKEWENIQESWKNRETGTEENVEVEDEVMFAKGGIASLKK